MQKYSVLFYLLVLLLLSLTTSSAFADQIQIDNNSIELRTKQVPLPTPIPTITHKPIVTYPKVLEDDTIPNNNIYISSDQLSFDPLTPTNPLLRNTTVSIDGTPANLYIYSTRPLQTDRHDIIPNTTCDIGDCSITYPGIWKDNLTYGFGFHNSIINSSDEYMQLPLNMKNSIILYQTDNASHYLQDNIIYKINIPTTQAPGIYSTTINYILVPML